MLTKTLTAAAIFLSACIGDGVEGTPGNLPTATSNPIEPIEPFVYSAPLEKLPIPDHPGCDLLAETEGACAHACDPVALLGYIPEGTCASFSCPLVDGTTLVTGGCNIPD